MNILTNKEVTEINNKINMLLMFAGEVQDNVFLLDKIGLEIQQLMADLDNSYKSGVDFKLKVIEGGKK